MVELGEPLLKDFIKCFCVINRVAVTLRRRRVIMTKRLRMDLATQPPKPLEADTLKKIQVIAMTLLTISGLLGPQEINASRRCQPQLTR